MQKLYPFPMVLFIQRMALRVRLETLMLNQGIMFLLIKTLCLGMRRAEGHTFRKSE